MKRIIIIFVLLEHFLLAFSLKYHEQVYYVAHGTNVCDTIRCVSFDIVNSNNEAIVTLFTEDDLRRINHNEALRRKCYRRYGDFSMASWAYDNVENCGEPYTYLFPQTFIKIIYPKQTFKVTIISSNIPLKEIESFISKHMIVCKESEINKYISDFIINVEKNKIICKDDFFVVDWKNLSVLENPKGS